MTDLQAEHDYIKLVEQHGSKGAAARSIGLAASTFKDRYKKQQNSKSLNKLGLKIIDAEAAVMDGLSVSGTSRYYKLEDGGVWVKTSKEKEDLIQDLNELSQGLLDEINPIGLIKEPEDYNPNMCSLIPIGDAHIGMYSWADETGEEYNLEIARKRLCAAFDYLINKSPSLEKCIIANVGDFMHYSMMQTKTERSGHILSVSGRPQGMVRVAVSALRYCIETAARKHKTVEVINACGNHDSLLAHTLNVMMDELYKDNPRIKVHAEPTSRHYTSFGKNLFGVVHGHETKDKDLPIIMAQEKPDLWGISKFRYWFRGHHHHDNRVEYSGAIVEQIRAFGAPDDYAIRHGYLSGNDLKQIYYHSEYGEQGRDVCGIDLLKSFCDE